MGLSGPMPSGTAIEEFEFEEYERHAVGGRARTATAVRPPMELSRVHVNQERNRPANRPDSKDYIC